MRPIGAQIRWKTTSPPVSLLGLGPHQELCVTVTLIAAVLAEDRQGVVAELDCGFDPGHNVLLG
jgi:hypothetical protein